MILKPVLFFLSFLLFSVTLFGQKTNTQQFYVGTALGFGMHHLPVMPCGFGVWMDEAGVHLSLIDTRFLFGYFWSDVYLKPDDPMAQVFAVFPTVVFNDLAATANGALGKLGVPEDEWFPLTQF